MYKTLKPFDIVTSPYVSINGTTKRFENGDVQKGLFLVLAVDYFGITCAKITSQSNSLYLTHSVILYKYTNPFLRTDSYVQLDKLHTLSAETATYVGFVDKAARLTICNTLEGYFSSVTQNLRRFCVPHNGYISPNLK